MMPIYCEKSVQLAQSYADGPGSGAIDWSWQA